MAYEQAATVATEPTNLLFRSRGSQASLFRLGGDPKRTLVLLHGGAAHAHWWDFVAPELAPYGQVVALDFRGHGGSDWV